MLDRFFHDPKYIQDDMQRRANKERQIREAIEQARKDGRKRKRKNENGHSFLEN